MTSPAAGPSPADRAKILLVDDSPDNLVSLEAALDGLQQDVIVAQSGQEALRCLLQDDFAAILLDVKMPEMDGFQTAELIRSRKRSRHTPILFLTGYKNEEHLFRGYDLGAVDFLFKPIVPEILRSKVSVFVELSRNAALLRHQTEILSKAERKFRALLEAAPDAMVIVDAEGRIALVNSQTERMFGYQREELLNQPVEILVPDRLRGRRKGGVEFPVEIALSPIETEEGVLVTHAIRDVTERERANDRIRELNTELERRVLARTQELSESNEALRRSNEDLNQFAFAASHDLQEPLRMVALYSEMLQQKYTNRLDEKADQFISFIINGALRMEMLLKDLLAFSQVGAVNEGPPAPVNTAAVVEKVLLNLGAAVVENRAVVTCDELPTVEAHEIRLVQLFQNLVGNAIKYRSADPPEIHISAKRQDEEWHFAVRDNGIGIHPDYVQQVFGIFKRLHGHAYPGTGIGLSICQRIVEGYGGRIWVESTLGQGSTFFFTLPVRVVRPVQRPTARETGVPAILKS